LLLPASILAVCDGNLCRSPFAEGYLRRQLELAGQTSDCFSRGIIAPAGHPSPPEAIATAAEWGVDLAAHRAQPLLTPDLDRAGIVLVMSPNQRAYLARWRPTAYGKVFLLANGEEIPDPMGKSEQHYREIYSRVAQACDDWLRRFGLPPIKPGNH